LRAPGEGHQRRRASVRFYVTTLPRRTTCSRSHGRLMKSKGTCVLLWPPSDSARNEVQTEARLFEKCVEAGRLWDRRCQQLERYYEEARCLACPLLGFCPSPGPGVSSRHARTMLSACTGCAGPRATYDSSQLMGHIAKERTDSGRGRRCRDRGRWKAGSATGRRLSGTKAQRRPRGGRLLER
jgi:hypothetical protein